MSERDISQASEEQGKDSLESTEAKQEERSLEDLTSSPESHVEATIDYKESEAVEATFTDLVSTDKQVSQTDPPEASGEEMKAAKKKEDGGDAATPINLPGPESTVVKETTTGQVEPKRMEKELPEGGQQMENLESGMEGMELEDVIGSMTGGPGDIPDGSGGKREDDDPTSQMPGGGLSGYETGGADALKSNITGGEGGEELHPGTGTPFIPGKGPGSGEMKMGAADMPWVQEAVAAVLEYGSEEDIAKMEGWLQDSALDEAGLVYGDPDRDDDGKGGDKSGETKSETPEGDSGGSDVTPVTKAELDAVLGRGDQISNQDPDSPGSGEGGETPELLPNLPEHIMETLKKAMRTKNLMVQPQMRSGAEVVTDPDSEGPGTPKKDAKGKTGAT